LTRRNIFRRGGPAGAILLFRVPDETNVPRKPVFFDPSQKRWRAAKRQGSIAAILLAALLVVLAGGIMDDPPLADMHLRSPVQARLSRLRAPNQKPRPKAPAREGQRGAASVAQAAAPAAARGPVPRRFAYFVNWDDNSLSSLRGNVNAIDVLVPEWLHLGSARGDIVVDNQRRQDEALALVAHAAHPPRVTPLINNVANDAWQGAVLDAALADPAARARMIDGLWRFVTVNRFAGISIDFEDVDAAHARDLEIFMAALYARFHPAGLTVSISIPAEDDTYRAGVLGRFADQVFLMEYDEHAATDEAGPIASQAWFDRTVAERMDEIDPSKVVVGLGGYAYDWRLGRHHAEELTFQETLRLAQQAQATIALDPSARNPTFRYDDEQGKPHAVWYLDAVTAYNEMVSAGRRHPYGFAIWRLGAEDPSLWRLFEHPEAMTGPQAAARLRDLNFRYDIEFGGTGEVLKVTSVPSPGLRDIALDRRSGLIASESVPRFPSGYGISRWGYRDKTIVLSFDDGPDPLYTPRILDILKHYGVHGSFFIVGMNAQAHPDLLRRIYDEGNEIGSHTFTHPNMSNVSPLQTTFELNATDRLLETVIGHDTVLFRPPYAEDMEPQTPEQVAPLMRTSRMGYYTVGMNIDPLDWATPGVDRIVSAVLEGARRGDGNVVLLHDSGGDREQTVAALPRIIEGLKAQGFRFATVGDLLGKPRDAVMPKVPAGMALLVASQRVAFTVLRYLRDGLTLLFGAGVVLGIGRAVLIAGLAFMPRRPLPACPDQRAMVSVVVPAYNEEKVIVSTVRSLLASTYANLDILVVDDGSTDGTAAAVRTAFAGEKRVRLISKPNGGKAEALNLGFNSTDAEVVVALDADTVFQPDTIANLVRHFSNPAVGAVAGNAKVGNRVNLLTRWQALEYITSQNLDRRAFDRLQCISVVPGAVGAWRREVVLALGGFGGDTLAEDADLTLRIIRAGYRVEYDDAALALTEAPETVGAFLKQRFRWMFGTLQAVWKHRDALLRRRAGTVGLVALPNVLVFQIFFPLISPIVDLTMLLSLAEMGLRALGQSEDPVGHGFGGVLACYLLFLAADYLATASAFLYEKGEQKSLLLWLFFQRFFYRQLIYYVAIKAMLTALRGSMVGWNKLERTATVPAAWAGAARDEAA
jgi:cellulose synthase/poly-beta-1,6-N-acetylglucosamine synthase-like glycosyltransferase/peptidoglycan/xylan/chitin deacetylase (PgdA/CDA1 family)/spore germination protein YaaH